MGTQEQHCEQCEATRGEQISSESGYAARRDTQHNAISPPVTERPVPFTMIKNQLTLALQGATAQYGVPGPVTVYHQDYTPWTARNSHGVPPAAVSFALSRSKPCPSDAVIGLPTQQYHSCGARLCRGRD